MALNVGSILLSVKSDKAKEDTKELRVEIDKIGPAVEKSTSKASTSLGKMGRKVGGAENATKGLKAGIDKIGPAVEQSTSKASSSLGKMDRKVGGAEKSTKRLKTGIDKIGPAARRSAATATSSFEKMRRKIGGVRTAVVSLGLALAVASGVRVFATFEQEMATVEAVTQATEAEMSKLNDTARQLGAATVFSAVEAARGMAFLGQASLDTNEIITAMPAILDLAAAGNLDLATTADKATNVLGQFNLEVEDLNRVVNIMAQTARSSNTNVLQMAEALEKAGLPASSLKVELADVAAVIGVMGDRALKAGISGRGLRQFLIRMANPTKEAKKVLHDLGFEMEELDIKTLGLIPVLETLARVEIDAGQAAKIWESETSTAALAIIAAAPGIKDFADEIRGATTAAKDMARVKLDTLAGDFRLLTSALSELSIVLVGDTGLSGKLREVTQGFTFLAQTASQSFKKSTIEADLFTIATTESMQKVSTTVNFLFTKMGEGAALTFNAMRGVVELAFNQMVLGGAVAAASILDFFSDMSEGITSILADMAVGASQMVFEITRVMQSTGRFNPDFVDGINEAALGIRKLGVAIKDLPDAASGIAADIRKAGLEAVTGSVEQNAARELEIKKRSADSILDFEKSNASDLFEVRARLAKNTIELASQVAGRVIGLSLSTTDSIKKDNEEAAASIIQLTQTVADRRKEIMASLEADELRGFKGIQAGMELFVQDMGTTSEQIASLTLDVANSIGDNITKAILDLGDSTTTAAEKFRSFASAVIKDILQMTVRMLVFRSLSSAFGFGITEAVGVPVPAAGAHSGGVVGSNVIPMRFHGGGAPEAAAISAGRAMSQAAPRKHDGGGVAGDEVAITARRGETILTEDQMQTVMNLGRQKPETPRESGETTIINVFSADQLGAALVEHPSALINPMFQNRRQIRRALAADG